MYESLIAKADQALSYLISYFEQVDRPALICFFRDHQPGLNVDFENALKEAGREDTDTDLTMTEKMYTVPYFIWSNYEIPEKYSMKNSKGEDVINTNYLGTLVRKYVGLELAAYDRYRMNQREQIPVFNFAGYMRADGEWYDLWWRMITGNGSTGTGSCSIMRCLISRGTRGILWGSEAHFFYKVLNFPSINHRTMPDGIITAALEFSAQFHKRFRCFEKHSMAIGTHSRKGSPVLIMPHLC